MLNPSDSPKALNPKALTLKCSDDRPHEFRWPCIDPAIHYAGLERMQHSTKLYSCTHVVASRLTYSPSRPQPTEVINFSGAGINRLDFGVVNDP